jgi:hypothetical protein
VDNKFHHTHNYFYIPASTVISTYEVWTYVANSRTKLLSRNSSPASSVTQKHRFQWRQGDLAGAYIYSTS